MEMLWAWLKSRVNVEQRRRERRLRERCVRRRGGEVVLLSACAGISVIVGTVHPVFGIYM